MADNQHGGARTRGARRNGVVGVLLIASMAIAWLAGALAQPAAADHGGSHAAQGYFLADSGGHMTRFGEAMDTGSLLGATLRAPIVDGDTTPSGNGSVLVASDGGVFAFGDAPFLGSMAGAPLAAPIVTIEMTATGRGYLMAAADGGVFAFGDARFRGSLGGLRLNQPIVDMALNAANDGYLLAGADGGVFAFGQSRFRGSMGGRPLNKPIVGILPGETTGYGLVASDGGIFAFGGFVFRGSLGSLTLQAPIVDAVVSSTGDGYNMVASDGGVFAFGDAPFVGSLARLPLPRPIVTILGLGNQPPTAEDDAYTTTEDTVLTRNAASGVLANDTDRDGDTLTAAVATAPTKGTLVLNGDGSFSYTPNANTNGADSFTYTVSDPHGKRDTATVSITVSPVNDPPVAANDTGATNEDTPLTVAAPGVLGNDTDVDGNPLTAAVVTGPTKGTLVLNSNGSFTYTPNANTNGPDSFTYRANDGTANSNTATVSLTVNAVNDAPVAVNDAYTTDEDTPLTVSAPGVLGNDSDTEGSALTAAVVTGPTKGTLTLNVNGSFTYTPNANTTGADSFAYRASDGTAQSNLATVSLTVNGVNDAPTAVNDAHSTNEDTPLNVAAPGVLGNDTDADGNALTAVLVTGPTKGTLTLNANGSFTYTPNANTNGADSFTYKANDGTVDSNVATVAITVNAVNDAPVAIDDAYTTSEDTPLTVTAPGVLANDTDIEGAVTATGFGDAVNGTVVGNADGSFTFTPTANFSGTASFGYTISDGTLTDTGAVTITVSPVNDAPAAGNNNFLTNEDTPFTVTAPGVLANDTDAEGNTLTATKLSDPTLGVLAFNADGSFTYTPNANANGVDSFTYKANDGSADSNTATVFITIDAVNDVPVAVDDGPFNAVQNQNLTLTAPGVLGNDTDADGQALTAGNASDPANGTVTLNPDGSFSYNPDTGFTGTDTFTYDASDGTATDTGLVTINVNPPNATPTADATSASGNEDGGAITVTLTGHDDDGDALTFSAGTAANGLITVPSGTSCDANTPSTCTATVTFTPNPNYNGSDSFTYNVNDGTVDSASATVTMTINAVNDEPSFTKGGNQAVNEDAGAQTVNGWATAISAGPANESAQAVTFTVMTDNDGLFSTLPAVSSAGNLTYTAAANANGSATVSVTAVDDGSTANGGDDTGATETFTVTVTAVNDVPSFTKGSDQTVNEDAGAQSVSNWATAMSKGPADESGQSLSFTTYNDNNGLFSVQPGVTPTGTLAYTPAADAVGSATVTIYLSDTGGTANGGDDTSDSQTFTITVNAVNDAPSFTKGANQTVNEDAGAQTVTGWATGISPGPADESAQTTTLETVGTSNNALFSALPAVSASGDLTYTPAANAFGSATVTVRAKDDGGTANGGADTSANQTFDITVNSVNDVPVANDDTASTDEDTSKVVAVLANDSDVDTADTLSVSAIDTTGTQGTVTNNGTNVTFNPGADFHYLDTGETAQTTFTYTVSDGNGGTDTATVTVTVTGVNDAPSATDQSHTGFGNTSLAVGGASVTGPKTTASGGALTGLTDPDDTSHTATTSGTSANGGTVGMNTDGTFSYLPAPGYEGSDTFDFTVSDGEATDTETVTVTVTGMAWYVDNSLGSTGDGRSSSPYNSLTPLNNDGVDLDAANETIFVYQGSGAYGALNLESGQKLLGHPYGLVTGPHTLVAENTAGTRPTISTVALGANSDLQAVVLGGNAGAPSLSGTNVGTATVGTDPDHDVTLNNPSGGGMTLNGGAPTIELSSLTSGGGTNGISLTNLGGSVTIPTGAITGASGSDIFVSGGNASTITYGGTVTNTAGRSVEILNRTAGTVTLSGAISDTAQGIALTNNDNSTVKFTSGSVTSTVTGANNAFAATQGGTVELTGANNTLSAAGGHALQVEDTTISNNGLVLKSVSATGGTHGIKLSSTGSGPVTVTGSGTAHSGGTISGTTSHGVSLNATTGVSLTRMRIQNSGDDGISGTNVTGFTFASGTVQTNGNAVGDGGMDFNNLLGTSNITSSTITASHDHNLDIVNDTGTATIGITSSTVTSSAINSGVNVETTSTGGGRAVATVNVTGTTTISDNFADGLQCSGTALSGAAGSELTCNVTGATFNSNNLAMDITQSQNADVIFNVQSNTITNHDSHAVNLFTNSPLVSGASMTGKFMNNSIGTAGVKDSGSATGSGLRAVIQGRADTAIRIENNTIRETPNWYGMEIYGRVGDGGADFTIVNNTVVQPTGTNQSLCDGTPGVMCPLDAFHIEANSGNVVCAKVSGNTAYDPTSVPPYGSGFAYHLRKAATAAPAGGTTATTFRLEGASGTGATEIAATNTGSPVQVDAAVTMVAPGTCTTVP